jgi:hypothetical protein
MLMPVVFSNWRRSSSTRPISSRILSAFSGVRSTSRRLCIDSRKVRMVSVSSRMSSSDREASGSFSRMARERVAGRRCHISSESFETMGEGGSSFVSRTTNSSGGGVRTGAAAGAASTGDSTGLALETPASGLGSGKRNSGGKAQNAAVTAMAVTAKAARKFSRRGYMTVASQEGGEKQSIRRMTRNPFLL